jgi:hypothetical protein
VFYRCRSKQRHTAGYQNAEGKIYYRFHPRFGETAILVRRHHFQGVEVFVIQQGDGTLAHIPCWMMREEAERFALQPQPRIPLDTLRDLRIEIDALLDLLLSKAETGEASNEVGTARTAAGLIRKQGASDQSTSRSGQDPHGDGPGTSDRNFADIEG